MVSRLASGGMATVYCAVDTRLDREVAIKVMHPHLAQAVNGADFVARFRREAKAAARLTHPHLVAVHDQGLDGDVSYLVMELVRGSNLRHRMGTEPPLTVDDAFRIMTEVLSALGSVHLAGLVHRDIKPENILLDRQGHVKVADFGLARAVTEVTAATTGTVLGTVAYLSPELIESGQADARTDVYAVGATLYELLTGVPMFAGETPIQVAMQHLNSPVPRARAALPWLPTEVDELIAHLTARDPDERLPDAAAALDELSAVHHKLSKGVLDHPVSAPPVPSVDRDDATADHTESALDETLPSGLSPRADGGTVDRQSPDNAGAANWTNRRSDAASPGGEVAAVGAAHDERAASPDDVGDPANGDAISPTGGAATGQPADASTSDAAAATSHTVAIQIQQTKRHDLRAQTATPARGSRGDQRPRSRRRPVAVTLMIALLVLAVGGGGLWWYNTQGPGAYTTVPVGLVSVSEDEASAALAEASLSPDVSYAYSDDIPAGIVMHADPASGDRVRKQSDVELTISQGIEHFQVPVGLVGSRRADAIDAVTGQGFPQPVIKLEYYDDVDRGEVTEVSAEEGSEQPHDTVLTLTVSDGKEPVTVPSVVGLSIDEAREDLEKFGLDLVRGADEYDAVIPEGKIISQSPRADARAHRTDEVTVTISRGPEMVTVPDVVRSSQVDAIAALERAGLKPNVNVYLDGWLDTVRFQSEEAGSEVPKGTTVTITVW